MGHEFSLLVPVCLGFPRETITYGKEAGPGMLEAWRAWVHSQRRSPPVPPGAEAGELQGLGKGTHLDAGPLPLRGM